MNKLTKLLSVFFIAGALGASVAGVAACKGNGGGDDEGGHSHNYTWVNDNNGQCHEHCGNTGCDLPDKTPQDHVWQGDECKNCHAAKPSGEDTQYEVAEYVCNFEDSSVAQYNGTKDDDGNTIKTPSDFTLGRFKIPAGTYVEPKTKLNSLKGNVNTQKKSIYLKVSGVDGKNRVSFKAMIASTGVDSAEIKLCKADGTVVKTFTLDTKDLTPFSTGYDFDNMAAGDVSIPEGDYYIECTTSSLRIGDLKIEEYVEVSPVTSITVAGGQRKFVLGADLSLVGLQVTAVKQSGVEIPLEKEDYTTNADTIDMSTAGNKTVTVSYTPVGSSTPITTSYTIEVIASQGITLNSEYMQKVYLKGATALDKSRLCVYADLGEGSSEKVTDFEFDSTTYDLNTAGEYNVKVKYNDHQETVKITVIESAIQAVNGIATVNVNAAHTGLEGAEVEGVKTFKSLKNAIKYLEISDLKQADKKVINVAKGKYEEMISTSLDNLTLIGKGANADETEITYKVVEGMINPLTGTVWGLDAATLAVSGTRFKAYNIAIRNDFDYIHESGNYTGNQAAQGLALSIGGDQALVYNCHLFGNQDTLYLKKGRAYFYETQIDGNIDFIFGNEDGIAYFEKCTIKAISRNGGEQEGYVTAMKGERGTGKKYAEYGYIFDDCTFTDDGKCAEGSMSLGRTWGKNPSVAIINSKLSKVYSKVAYGTSDAKTTRYSSMNGTPVDAFFVECNNEGIAADNDGSISANVTGCKVINDATAYNKTNIFAANNGSIEWGVAWNWGKDYTTLRILAGLEQGELPQEDTITIGLKDNTLTNGNCVSDINTRYGDLLTWTGTGSFQNQTGKIENGVQIGLDTVITFKVVGEVAITPGYYTARGDFSITYSEGKATIKVVAVTGQYGTFIGGLVIDTTKTPEDSVAASVTVNYNDDGTTANGNIDGTIGNPIKKPTDPTREGYIFMGWKKDGADYNWATLIEGGFTITAEWAEEVQITLNYNDDGATTDGKIITPKGYKATKPVNPSRDGYKFTGWKDSAGNDFDWNTVITGPITLTAQWVGASYETITAENCASATLSRKGSTADLQYSDTYFNVAGDWSNANTHPTFRDTNKVSFYVTAGAHIDLKALYSSGTYTFKAIVDGNEVGSQSASPASDHINIDVNDLLGSSAGTTTGAVLIEITAKDTAYLHEIVVTYPA